MPSDVMTDLIRGLIAPVARAFEAAGRAGRRGAVRRTIRVSRRERAALENLDDRLLKDVGLIRDGDHYRPR